MKRNGQLSTSIVAALILLMMAGTLASHHVATAADPKPPNEDKLAKQAWAVIKQKCQSCHQPKKREGALDMSSRATLLKGGHSGAAFAPGDADASLMIELIEFDEMPPRKQKENRVTAGELKTLRAWIAAGGQEPKPATE